MAKITRDLLQGIKDSYDDLAIEVDCNNFNPNDYDCTDRHEDDDHIDQYIRIGVMEACITTDKETNETYVSSDLTLYLEDENDPTKIESYPMEYEDIEDTIKRMDKYELDELDDIYKVISENNIQSWKR